MSRILRYSAVLAGVCAAACSCGKKREAEAAFSNARSSASAGRYRAAITHYQSVTRQDYDGVLGLKARMKMGEIYFKRLKEYDEAKGIYRMVQNLFPGTKEAAEAETKLKEIESIVKIKAAALAEGDSLAKQGRYRDALEKYRTAESLQPGNPLIEGRIESTRDLYEAERKRDAAAAVGRGDVYLAQNRWDEAMKEYLEARELTPEDEELWDKIDVLRMKLEPVKREDSFEDALENGVRLDPANPATVASLLEKLPAPESPGTVGSGGVKRQGGEICVADFSIPLPDYKHYFQGYELSWTPGRRWSTVTFSPAVCHFPFLKMPMRDFEKFEEMCGGGEGETVRPRLRGVALIRILGRSSAGTVSAELVDARIEIPAGDHLYVLREKEEGQRRRNRTP